MKKINTKDLLESSIKELQFEKLNVEYLYSVLSEIETIGDELVKHVIRNAKEKHQLNKMIHANNLLKNN